MKQKLLLAALLTSTVFMQSQNGTRPDEAKVILGSNVVRTINVLANDNAVAGKSYQLIGVFNLSSKNIAINTSGNNATYQDNHGAPGNDTFYYIAKDINSGTQDTNYVVIKKDNLNLDMYPGDANRDNICNNIDILNIGVAYGKNEIEREGIYRTDNWTLVKAYDWSLTNMKSNYRYSDANGDGIVDSTGDINTVVKNYNRQIGLVNVHYSPTGGEAFQIIAPDTLKFETATGNFSVKINLGTASAMVEKAYGLAFTIKYNPLHIKANGLSFSASKWFSDNQTSLNFSQVNPDQGELDITMVRKTGIGSSGRGELGIIDVVIEDILVGITEGINTSFEIIKPVLIDSVYNVLPITLPAPKPVHMVKKLSSSVRSIPSNSGFRYNLQDVILNLKNENARPLEVSVFNILGKEISKKILAPNQLIETDISHWSSGIYFLRTAHEAHKIHVK